MRKNLRVIKGKINFVKILFLIVSFTLAVPTSGYCQGENLRNGADSGNAETLSLNDCIKIALENNHNIKVSEEGIRIAEARKRQAESGYWPQVSAAAAYSLTNRDPLFILPGFNMSIPPITLFGTTLNMGNIEIPEEDIKLMDKQNIHASLDVTYPVYTGGKVQAYNKEAKYGIEIANQDFRKSNLQVAYDVKRFYYSVLLAKKIYKIGSDALDRLNITLELTESLYKNGSGKTTKLDYLKNKVIVDQVKALVGGLKENINSAKQALEFTMGFNKEFSLPDEEIPFDTADLNEGKLIVRAFNSNPDWNKLNAAVFVYKAKIDEAESGFLPDIAVIGSFNQNFNSYKYGISNRVNSSIWLVGIGAQIPIFNGFRTKNEVGEADAQLKRINEQKNLLHDAIILQIKEALNKIESSVKNVKDTFEAHNAAAENSSLSERAFQQDMAQAKDLIEAQIWESLTEVQYQKALYDHALAEANLELLIGTQLKGK